MKLIHSGKVLKDDATIESCNIKPNAFLVVMISKVSLKEHVSFYLIEKHMNDDRGVMMVDVNDHIYANHVWIVLGK